MPSEDAARLRAYVAQTGNQVDDLLWDLRQQTHQITGKSMYVSPDQGRFLGFLIEVMGAKRVIEIGTFTGYSSICIARALPEGGRLLCLDSSKEWTDIARKAWQAAGVSGRIDLIVAPAEQSLWHMMGQGFQGQIWQGTVDFIFIDANKSAYSVYYDYAIDLLRPGGVIVCDNVLWRGLVADPDNHDPVTQHMRAITNKMKTDPRVSTCLLPIGDGFMMARKLPDPDY